MAAIERAARIPGNETVKAAPLPALVTNGMKP